MKAMPFALSQRHTSSVSIWYLLATIPRAGPTPEA
jgi:hypothetical protein